MPKALSATSITMISKSDLIKMLWGIAIHNSYWVDLNLEIVGGGGEIVAKAEQVFARKIGMNFLKVSSEFRRIDGSKQFDIPSIVLSGELPKKLAGTKIAEYIGVCIEQVSLLSNENT